MMCLVVFLLEDNKELSVRWIECLFSVVCREEQLHNDPVRRTRKVLAVGR